MSNVEKYKPLTAVKTFHDGGNGGGNDTDIYVRLAVIEEKLATQSMLNSQSKIEIIQELKTISEKITKLETNDEVFKEKSKERHTTILMFLGLIFTGIVLPFSVYLFKIFTAMQHTN